MVKALDYGIVVSEFELQLRYYVHFRTNTLGKGMNPLTHNECPGYDTKQSDGEVPVMLEIWGMRSTPLLPLLSGPLRPGVVAPDKGPIYGLNRTKPWFLDFTVFCI